MPDFLDDMEQLSREAAENFNMPAKALEWDTILNRLDQEMPVKKKKRRFIIFFLLFLIGLGLWGYFIFNNPLTEKKLSVKHNTSTSVALPDTLSIYSGNNKTNTENTLNAEIKNSSNIFKSGNQKTYETGLKQTNIKKQLARFNAINSNKNLASKLTMIFSLNEVHSFLDNNKTVLNNKGEVSNNKLNDAAKKSPVLDSSSNTSLHSMVLQTDTTKNISKDTTTVSKSNQVKKKKPSFRKIELTAIYGPDLDFVDNFSRPGNNYGLLISYPFTSRWFIRSGVAYIHNIINISGNNYPFTPDPNLPAYTTIKLEHVNGYSDFLEIPLTIGYQIAPAKRVSYYSQIGVTSFFVQKEVYDYQLLLDGTNRINWRSFQGESGDANYHGWFGILNTNLGVKIRIKPNLFFNAEAYLKLPFEDIDEGHYKPFILGFYTGLTIRPFNNLNKKN